MSQASGDERTRRSVLERWRLAERELESATPGSAEWHRARLEVEQLSAEYQDSVAARDHVARELATSASTGDLPAPSEEDAEPLADATTLRER